MEIFCLNENNEIIKNKPKIDTFFFFSFSRSHTVERNKFEAIQCSKKKNFFPFQVHLYLSHGCCFFSSFVEAAQSDFFFFKHDNVGYDLIVPHDSFVPRPPARTGLFRCAELGCHFPTKGFTSEGKLLYLAWRDF